MFSFGGGIRPEGASDSEKAYPIRGSVLGPKPTQPVPTRDALSLALDTIPGGSPDTYRRLPGMLRHRLILSRAVESVAVGMTMQCAQSSVTSAPLKLITHSHTKNEIVWHVLFCGNLHI